MRAAHGPLAWGIDPSSAVLDAWELKDTAAGLDRFADIVLDAAVGTVGIIKPQAAFFERHGWEGVRTLQRLVAAAREAGLLVIVDAKRGDVSTTNAAYAEAYLGVDAPIACDALTVHPYLGFDAMEPFIDRAVAAGSCILVVTRSSNPEGRSLQSALIDGATTVEGSLLAAIGARNAQLAPEGLGPIGAVVGATRIDPALDLAQGRCIFLAPGVGAQGASPQDVARAFAACPGRVIPSASRSLLDHGPDVASLRSAASSLAAEFRALLAG